MLHNITRGWIGLLFSGLAILAIASCHKSITTDATTKPSTSIAAKTIIRINAGTDQPFKDSQGNTWLPDTGFADGETVTRDEMDIANTKDGFIYRTEHWGMTEFSYKVPNGTYTLRLHFCETNEPTFSAGARLFTFTVKGHAPITDFDVFARAGGPKRAYVETIKDVVVTDGKISITFEALADNPEINGIEIIPQ